MQIAVITYMGLSHILFSMWPCMPGKVTGRALESYNCAAIEDVVYDDTKLTLFCIDGQLWAQCPL